MIEEAESLLLRASARNAIGRYQIEGALQSAHVHRRRTGEANWSRGGRTVRRVARDLAIAGRRDQPRACVGAAARCALGARCARLQRRPIRGSSNTNPIGPHAPSCWRRSVRQRRRATRLRHCHRARARRRGPAFPATTTGRADYCFCRFLTRSSTTAGSASVVVSPRFSSSFAAILRRMRRMILPERVFGNPGAH